MNLKSNKKCYLAIALFAFLMAPQTGFARGKWMLSGKTYDADTLHHVQLTNGITETHIRLTGPSSINLFYLTLDMKTPGLSLRPIKGFDRSSGLETISQMLRRNIAKGHNYVAAVNADFFSFQTLQPIGAMQVDGNILTSELSSDYAYLAIDSKGTPYLTDGSASQALIAAGSDTLRIQHVNRTEEEKGIILYTPDYGASTGRKGQYELILEAKGPLAFNKPTKCKVNGINKNGDTELKPGTVVISVPAADADQVTRLAEADKVTVEVDMTFDAAPDNDIVQLVAGKPMLVRNGQTIMKNNALDHLPQLHPRTAIGYDKDKSRFVLMVVDGRTNASAGMTSYQLADAMLCAGCHEAMNLDGGGSSELYTIDGGVRNVVSDGHERAVTNGLGVIIN